MCENNIIHIVHFPSCIDCFGNYLLVGRRTIRVLLNE